MVGQCRLNRLVDRGVPLGSEFAAAADTSCRGETVRRGALPDGQHRASQKSFL